MQANFNSIINPSHGENLNLFFSCKNLKNKDITSASDPQLFLFLLNKGQKVKIGESEKVRDNLNPEFSTNFNVFYHFEFPTHFEVEVWDIDQNDKDFLGKTKFELGELIGKRKENLVIQMTDQKGKNINSWLTVKYEKAIKSKTLFNFKFKTRKIEDIEFWSKSDPFLRFYKHTNIEKTCEEDLKVDDPNWKLTHETEYYPNNLNPSFNQFRIPDFDFCSSNTKLALKAEVWDYSSKGKHSLIGHFFFCLADILNGRKEFGFISKRKKNKSAGTLILEYLETEPFIDFIDYLNGGLILNCFIAIDFTLSNYEPQYPSSLHYMGGSMNQYQTALIGITSIILNYDIDKKIPVFGFGGIFNNTTSHCFPLSGSEETSEGFMVEGVLQLYDYGIKSYKLSGPTNFMPIIRKSIFDIKQKSSLNILNYQILVILTDGEITDMEDTKDAIVEASFYPMSIIIVGVGNANFDKMNILDGDGQKLKDRTGKLALRDIVQFVPFRDLGLDPIRLAAATLAELPSQVLEFYRINKIYPVIK